MEACFHHKIKQKYINKSLLLRFFLLTIASLYLAIQIFPNCNYISHNCEVENWKLWEIQLWVCFSQMSLFLMILKKVTIERYKLTTMRRKHRNNYLINGLRIPSLFSNSYYFPSELFIYLTNLSLHLTILTVFSETRNFRTMATCRLFHRKKLWLLSTLLFNLEVSRFLSMCETSGSLSAVGK